jgi:hypothetical protein
MMKEGLIDSIRAIGHWRVNIRPLQPLAEKLSFQRCYDEVDRARISIRGWDYPHISRHQDDNGGWARIDDYVESWCSWHTQLEFWRMYKGGQFLSYNALHDDVAPQGTLAAGALLSIRDAIYSITEFVEFTQRLFANGLYRNGAHIRISLNNTAGRQLWVGPGRMPFLDPRQTGSRDIHLERDLGPNELAAGAIEVSLAIILEFFDYFGWNPAPAQIRSDLESFYRRDFR